MSWVQRGLFRILLAMFLVLAMLTSFGHYLDTTLTLHMVVQHLFYLAAGFLLASGADMLVLAGTAISRTVSRTYAGLLRINATYNKKGLLTFFAAGILVAFWHLPANFDAAVLNESVHVVMHTTFLLVGSLIFVGSKLFTWRVRTFLLLVPSKAMGIFGAFLMFTTNIVYDVYPASQQTDCGLVMVAMMLGMDLTLVPYWLYKYFQPSPKVALHVPNRAVDKT
jgi:cytochrome c oxidase assembly factor CtaG